MKVESVVTFWIVIPEEVSLPFDKIVKMCSRGDPYTIEDWYGCEHDIGTDRITATVTSVTDAVHVAGFVQRCVDRLTDFGMIEEFSSIDVSIRITGGSV